jgi:hypothetical protein
MSRPGIGAAGLALPVLAAAALAASAAAVPEALPQAARDLATALDRVAGQDSLGGMQAAHADSADERRAVRPHAEDLAGGDGALLVTLLDRLDEQLDAGNASDAEDLARAAASTTRSHVVPAADTWSRNRTAVGPGEATWQGDRVAVPVVLHNAPPAGLGAFDVELALAGEATPVEADVAVGRGEATVDPDDGTARVASFDPAALANLDPGTGEAAVLGTVLVDGEQVASGDELRAEARPLEVATPDGHRVVTLGLAGNGTVPEPGGELFNGRVLALAGVGVGAVVALAAARRLEV